MLSILELMLTLVFIVGVVTQLIIPGIKNTIIFPLFRKERRELEGDLNQAKEETELADLEKRIQDEKVHKARASFRKL